MERPRPLPFFLIYLVAGIGFGFAQKGGLYTLAVPLLLTFVAVPIFDALMGIDTRDPAEAAPGAFASAIFRLATWVAVPAQAAATRSSPRCRARCSRFPCPMATRSSPAA